MRRIYSRGIPYRLILRIGGNRPRDTARPEGQRGYDPSPRTIQGDNLHGGSYGVSREIIAYNFFTIVGTENNSMGIRGKLPTQSMAKIVETGRNG
jgi:hypothetical protein